MISCFISFHLAHTPPLIVICVCDFRKLYAPLIFFLLLPENGSENQTHQWSTVKQLVEKCHGEVHCPGLDKGTKGLCLLKQKSGNQTHNRTHDTANANGDCIGDKLWSVLWCHHLKSQSSVNFSNYEKLQHKCDRQHNRHLMKSCQESLS